MTGSTRLKRTLALALAGGSLAIGVPAALASGGGGGGEDGGGTAAPASTFIQDEQPRENARPDREDCPEKDGGQRGGGQEGEQQDSSTGAPAV